MLNPKDAVYSEIQPRRSALLTFRCKAKHCDNTLVCPDNPTSLRSRTGFCRSCSNVNSAARRNKPFTCAYNTLRLGAKRRNIPMNITFVRFLEYTKVKHCHYCDEYIPWAERNKNSYFLDRKNNFKGYTEENVVVCCSSCNEIKGRHVTYEEMLILRSGLLALTAFRRARMPSIFEGANATPTG